MNAAEGLTKLNSGYLFFRLIFRPNRQLFVFFIQLIWGSLNKFPDFFRMNTFIDSTHMKL